jgi:hypothetical protein
MAQRKQRELKAVQDLGNHSMEVPPSQVDQRAKTIHRAAMRAVKLSNKRTALVSSHRAENGLDLLSNELQQAKAKEIGNDINTHPTVATTAKKRRVQSRRDTVTDTTPPTLPVTVHTPPPSVPQIKCQGCVHCDLLELRVVEQRHVPTYLKDNAFLAAATCAGACHKALRDIYAAAPRDIIHYCDTGKKGFDAPDDEALKQSMECGLMLCLPCYEERRLQYEMETGAANGGRRISRRSNKPK